MLEKKMPRIRPVFWSNILAEFRDSEKDPEIDDKRAESDLSGDDPAELSLPRELCQIQSHMMCESAIS